MTVAIFGYPPVAWWSAIITSGCPSGGTWTAPGGTPSEMISARRWVTGGPSSR